MAESVALPPYYRSSAGHVAQSEVDIPAYTSHPSVGEERLSRPTSGPGQPHPQSQYHGEFVRTVGRITLTLKNQPPDALIPTYAPGELVTGSIRVHAPENVTEVVLKVLGRMELATTHGGRRRDIVKASYTAWNNDLRFHCPPSIPFSFIFPSTFADEEHPDIQHDLPPTIIVRPPETYTIQIYKRTHANQFISAKCTYNMSVLVSTALHPRLTGLWRGEKSLDVPLHIRVKSAPSRPIMPDPRLLSTVKSAPEEWRQIVCELGPHLRGRAHCNLFIPASQMYGLDDQIPVHLQVSGPINALRILLHPSCPRSRMSLADFIATAPTAQSDSQAQSHSPSRSSSGSLPDPAPSASRRASLLSEWTSTSGPPARQDLLAVRVHLLRRVHIALGGQVPVCRDVCLGLGKLVVLPPPMDHGEKGAGASAQIDWAGEVRVLPRSAGGGFAVGVNANGEVLPPSTPTATQQPEPGTALDRIATFSSGALWVEDMIVVSIPQWDVEHRHPVRFVSDTWVDDVGWGYGAEGLAA
ncbi:hypothetical protein MKEN_00931400 [Mycena kentingensis (nom. inval.)]|nr:hypothetical protein MKEN_00931400 [Mycena kentingensis (nom. inval.)]